MKQETKQKEKKEELQKEKEEVIIYLRELLLKDLPKGQNPTLYTSCRHVSNSGMMRHINVFAIVDNQPININWYIEKLGMYKRGSYNSKNSDSLRVGGCGMDMGFSVVYNISRAIFKDYDFKRLKVQGRNGDKYETTDSGYIINQRWV
jgi:hypothetical protein